MSYRERRLRKDRKGKPGKPRERTELDSFTVAKTYKINPDGTKALVLATRIR